MPSFSRMLLLAGPSALFTVAFVAPVAPALAKASPVPLPLPLLNADYGRHLDSELTTVAGSSSSTQLTGNNTSVSGQHTTVGHVHTVGKTIKRHAKSASHRLYSRDVVERTAFMDQMRSHRDSMVANSRILKAEAAQSASPASNNAEFHRNAAAHLTSFYSSMQQYQGLLKQLGAEKGLANYDKNDDLETILKDVINANKNALVAVSVLVHNIPILGPILGPIVYDIKCLIDDILNAVENLTDGLLNVLLPLLQDLRLSAALTTCAPGIKLLGLCL